MFPIHTRTTLRFLRRLWSLFAPDIPIKLQALQKGTGGFRERNELLS